MIQKAHYQLIAAVFFLAVIAVLPCAAQKEFSNWPAASSPAEVGKRVAERFFSSAHLNANGTIYTTVGAWYGALTFAEISGDKDLLARLQTGFDAQLTPEQLRLALDRRHVDYSIIGAVPLQLYLETRQPRYLELGRKAADHQWEDPLPDGLSAETRYWIDDMYMITILQVQAYRATGEKIYIDRAAQEMVAYLDKLRRPNGLFYHAPDAPFFWGRGNGWVAAGMAELLRSLPANHPLRPRIMTGYRTMIATLLKLQGKDGLWRQLLDRQEAWPETSSTAMFTFAMITGVKEGWLKDKAYRRAARNGWLGLVRHLNADSDLTDVCEGTGRTNDLAFYLKRQRLTGDLHGQAPLLWSAAAFLRK